jgi:hypothetical protein
MSFFPPSGYPPDAADGTDPKWTRWFAWYPVGVDAYKESEIRRGKFYYYVWLRWVECRLRPDDPPPLDGTVMQFRLPQHP